jgi:hypothetical protein
MPRLTNATPSYREHRPSGQAVVTLDGRDHYCGPHGTRPSRAEYDRLIGEWLANGRRPLTTAGDLTVAELVAQFWITPRRTIVTRTGRRRRSSRRTSWPWACWFGSTGGRPRPTSGRCRWRRCGRP